jgi:uncharacterized protein (TIGR02001 family)
MASPTLRSTVPSAFGLLLSLLCLVCGAEGVLADDNERWPAPFGGFFNAAFTFATDYSFAGISQTKNSPAYQMGIDYRSKDFGFDTPVWFYASGWGSNIDFPSTGQGIEVDVAAGFKARAFNRKLSLDLGYIRYTFLGPPADLAYNYGDINLNVGYDFGYASLAARVRFSPNSFGDSGHSWNKRALLTVPLPFLSFNENIAFKTYGALGNLSVDRFAAYGIPSSDYWYWQVALVTSAYGLDVMVAYTDTSIDPAGCAYTSYCSGRVFMSVSKAF